MLNALKIKNNYLNLLIYPALFIFLQLVDFQGFNRGAVVNNKLFFGLAADNTIAIILTILMIAALASYLKKTCRPDRQFILFALIGSGSNLLDRVLYGGVIDYVNLFNITLCNLSDIVIVISLAVSVVLHLKKSPA